MPWWRDAVLYQIYVRSFADADGDGIGDLLGIVAKLDHLAWLGVDAIWLSPIHPSPDQDWGYDVADYYGVHPELGKPGDVERLIREAGQRGIRVLLDLVPNHTSDRHPWFVDAKSSRSSQRRDWYVWADGRPDGSPPNNWRSSFGGPAWSFDDATGQWYLHHFLPSQPDLNWWSPAVRESLDAILRHWFDRGVAGMRIDVCNMIVKDRELRDNPPATDDDPAFLRMLGQRQLYDSGRPELHDVLRRWRRIADAYSPPRLLLGETYVFDLAALASFYGSGDELSLAFNMPFVFAPLEAGALGAVVAETEGRLGAEHWPVWTLSNHDVSRFPTRWCAGDGRKVRCALLLLLGLRGGARPSCTTATRSACRIRRSRSQSYAIPSVNGSGLRRPAGTRVARRCNGMPLPEQASRSPMPSLGSALETTAPATSPRSETTRRRSWPSVAI